MRVWIGFWVAVAFLGLSGCGAEDPCEGIRCSDNNECTEDRCVDGACEYPPVENGQECDDQNQCTSEMCIGGRCHRTPVSDGEPCGEGDGECLGEVCREGVCDRVPTNDGNACENDDGNECTAGLCGGGVCAAMPLEDGAPCGGDGRCQGGVCDAVVGSFACTEEGIRAAIATGGGPHRFDCAGPTRIETDDVIVIHSDVILDGEGNLTIAGAGEHRLFRLAHSQIGATLSGMTLRDGYVYDGNGGAIASSGTLSIHHSLITANTAMNTASHIRGHGGGIYNTGNLTLNDCMMSENRAVPICIPDCVFFCACGGYGDDIANEGGTVALIDTIAHSVYSWSGATQASISTEELER